MARYRMRRDIAINAETGRVRRYADLATFNKRCKARGNGGDICVLRNLRCLKDGGGLATVTTHSVLASRGHKETWRLHFASCSILKDHLTKRVGDPGGYTGKEQSLYSRTNHFGYIRGIRRNGSLDIFIGRANEWDPVSRTTLQERVFDKLQRREIPCVRVRYESAPYHYDRHFRDRPEGKFYLDDGGDCIVAFHSGGKPADNRRVIKRELKKRVAQIEARRQRPLL